MDVNRNGDLKSPLSSLSDKDNEDELESEDGEVSRKIPKPPGEVGHLQSGGYNLQDKLDWSNRTYDSIIVSWSKDKLDITKRFCGQDMKTIKQICDAVSLSLGSS